MVSTLSDGEKTRFKVVVLIPRSDELSKTIADFCGEKAILASDFLKRGTAEVQISAASEVLCISATNGTPVLFRGADAARLITCLRPFIRGIKNKCQELLDLEQNE